MNHHYAYTPKFKNEMSTTDNPKHPDVNVPKGEGEQNKAYLVLSEEERKKGFIRPLYSSYTHVGKKIDKDRVICLEEYVKQYNEKYDDNKTEEEEKKQWEKWGYVGYISYTKEERGDSSVIGTFVKQKDLDGGCGVSTKINSQAIIETYARDPKFYGSTWCMGCRTHVPNPECVWDNSDNLRVGE